MTKRAAAAALFLDEQGRILCVKPTYREEWLVPGGAVEPGESPHAACRREVAEEIGLDVAIGRLLCVDHRWNERLSVELLHFVFWAGELSEAREREIVLAADEIAAYRFMDTSDAALVLDRPLGRRIALALVAQREGRTVYAEDGREVLDAVPERR